MISTKKYVSTIILLLVLVGGAFAGGLKLGGKGYIFSGHTFSIINQNNSPKTVDYSLLWQVLDNLNQNDIDKPLDQQKLLFGAAQGLVAAVGDPYTVFFNPQQYKDFQTELGGSFEGIGAEVRLNNGALIIAAPLDGSPAKKAGLLPGDQIIKIDGADITGLTLDDAVNKIRGPKGTIVKLTILRGVSTTPMDFSVTRDTITVQSVKHSVMNDNGKKIEYINITTFGSDTVALFTQAVNEALSNKVSGIILDLRDDGGGYLDDAVKIGSYWVQPGNLIVSEQHSDGTKQDYSAAGGNSLSALPTFVLVNGGTASASEILSGALHDYGFAKLIGEKTFGKGSVQELISLPDATALKVTIAKWLTPKGVNLNHNGLNPDIPVTRTPDQIQKNQDPQMDKALQLLAP